MTNGVISTRLIPKRDFIPAETYFRGDNFDTTKDVNNIVITGVLASMKSPFPVSIQICVVERYRLVKIR